MKGIEKKGLVQCPIFRALCPPSLPWQQISLIYWIILITCLFILLKKVGIFMIIKTHVKVTGRLLITIFLMKRPIPLEKCKRRKYRAKSNFSILLCLHCRVKDLYTQ